MPTMASKQVSWADRYCEQQSQGLLLQEQLRLGRALLFRVNAAKEALQRESPFAAAAAYLVSGQLLQLDDDCKNDAPTCAVAAIEAERCSDEVTQRERDLGLRLPD